MKRWLGWAAFGLILASLAVPQLLYADYEGESLLTPNQQRRAAQVNETLVQDIVDQPNDTSGVAKTRRILRKSLKAYQKAVRKYGSSTPQSRKAARVVMDAQKDLHQQTVKEDAPPATPLALNK